MAKSVFENYWEEVASLLGGNPSHKSFSIELSENPPTGFDGRAVVGKLYESLDCEGWKNISHGKNWEWRSAVLAHRAETGEVALEREVVAADTFRQWTFQMSTASGIDGGRRSIDLVRRMAPHQYAFIELKVAGGDNPLYAAFELLSYTLAYLHSMRRNWQGRGRHNVMDAQAVNLIVLGPSEWYEYKKRGTRSQSYKFKLGWLAMAIADGLDFLTDGTPQMRFSYKEFTDLGATKLTAKKIVDDALQW